MKTLSAVLVCLALASCQAQPSSDVQDVWSIKPGSVL